MIRRIITLATCLAIAACSPTPQPSPAADPQAWFDMPLPGTIFYPPNPCQVVAHGASSNGIALFELTINGTVAANIPHPDEQETLATLAYPCSLLQPGKNLLKVRAYDMAGGWSGYAETTVILAGDAILPDEPTVTVTIPPRVTETALTPFPTRPTLTPTRTPTRLPSGSVTIERVSTYLVYFGAADCGPLEVTITARTTAPKGIQAALLYFRFQTDSSSTEFQNVAMSPIGGDLYQATLNPTSLLGDYVLFDRATLQYQVVIQQNGGDTSLRTTLRSDINVEACARATPACSSYTDERTCIANGCNWVAIPGTVPIYECRDP